jgi:hypothetical protein
MANPFRGELQVSLGGKAYKTRMTVDGCMQAESACGTSLVRIATKLSEGDLTVMDIANVLTPAFKGGGNDFDQIKVAKIVYEAGLAEGMRVCGEVLANVLTAGQSSSEDSEEDDEEGSEKNELETTE